MPLHTRNAPLTDGCTDYPVVGTLGRIGRNQYRLCTTDAIDTRSKAAQTYHAAVNVDYLTTACPFSFPKSDGSRQCGGDMMLDAE
jgi:hypothetical protein